MTKTSPKRRRPSDAKGVPTSTRRFQRTRKDHAQELAEDYVELIGDLIDETREARAVDIAERLGVSHVTVTKAIGRLKRDGLVISEPYRSIFLTDKGKKLAEESRKRHTLVVEFLLALGVPHTDAEIDAEGIEHHVSDATLQAMKRYLKTAAASARAN